MELQKNTSLSTSDISAKLRDLFASNVTEAKNKSALVAESISLKAIEMAEESSEVSGDEFLKSQRYTHSPSLSLRGNIEDQEIASESTADRISRMSSYANLQGINLQENLVRSIESGNQIREGIIQENIELKQCIDRLDSEFKEMSKTHSMQISKMKRDYQSKQEEMQKCKGEKLDREKYLKSLDLQMGELDSKNLLISRQNNTVAINKQIETIALLESQKRSLISRIEETGYSSSDILSIISANSSDLKKRLADVETQSIEVRKKECTIPSIRHSLADLIQTLEQKKAQELSLISETAELEELVKSKKINLCTLSNNLKRITENGAHSYTEVFLDKQSQEELKRRKRCSEQYEDLKYLSHKSSSFYFKVLLFFLVMTLCFLAFSEFLL